MNSSNVNANHKGIRQRNAKIFRRQRARRNAKIFRTPKARRNATVNAMKGKREPGKQSPNLVPMQLLVVLCNP